MFCRDLLTMARTGLDRAPFPPCVESDRALVGRRWRNVIRPAWGGGSWTPDLGSRSIPVSSGQLLQEAHLPPHPPSGAGSVLRSAAEEAGSCRASHLRWGGDFDPPPPSSLVFTPVQNTVQDCPASVLFPEACTSAAVLSFFSFIQALRGRGGRCQWCRWRTGGAWGFSRPQGGGWSSSHRPEEQCSGWKHGLPR